MLYCVAAGGNGTRLYPATISTNKHLLPAGDKKLMIDHPLRTFLECGAKDVVVVTGAQHASQIVDYVSDGQRHGFDRIEYAFQAKASGIADVLKRIFHKSDDDGVVLILGDNYFSHAQPALLSLDRSKAAAFQYDIGSAGKAKAFGQIIFDRDGYTVRDIVEKPANPQHSNILTGLYYFPEDVFNKIEQLSPSARNELEITDLLRLYLSESRLQICNVVGDWTDLGEWSSLVEFWRKQ